MVVQHPI